MKLSKSKTQHVIHKIYSHFIETLPSKSETQHGVRVRLRDYLFVNDTIIRKDFSFFGKFCELKQVRNPTCHSQNLPRCY